MKSASSDCPDPVALAQLPETLNSLGLIGPRPVLVLIGGAASLAPAVADRLRVLFERLAPWLDALGVTLIDGGTAFGVMAAMGAARQRTAAGFPLVGVAARGTVDLTTLPAPARVGILPDTRPGRSDADIAGSRPAPLDPHHSHFLLVPGARWGDESAWIAAVAATLAAGRPALVLVAGGGQITRRDVAVALDAGQRLLVLAGSGGTADRLADAWRQELALSPGTTARPAIEIVELDTAAVRLPALLTQAFSNLAD